VNPIVVANKKIGPRQPCFIAAEVGINHNGSLSLAKEMIDAASEAGADGVKFQNYAIEDFLFDTSLTYTYVSQGVSVTEPQIDMFRRYILKREWLPELKAQCERRGVMFFCTPMGEGGLRDLVEIGCALLKNGSDCLGHLPLIRSMARTGIPTVLSTGMATLAEIDEAVRAFREAGGKELALLHCISSYPTPPEDVHLRKIPALAAAFECPIGFSDHTRGIVAAAGAVTLGACFVEKHFTLDKNLPGPDHCFSSDPAEMKALVDAVRTVEKNLGNSAVGPAGSEMGGRRDFRLSCVVKVTLPAGHRLSVEEIGFRRPGTGLPPAAVEWIVGRRLRNLVGPGHVLGPDDFI